MAAAALPNSCSMDSRRVAERAEEDVGVINEGAKADAVARDAISAREAFIFKLFVGR